MSKWNLRQLILSYCNPFFFCNQRKCLDTSANLNHPKYFRLNQWKICLRQLFFVDFWCSTSFSDIASEELNGHFSIELFDWLTNFYRYLTKILISFTSEKQKLIHRLVGDEKSKVEINTFWDNAMSFNEWSLIIEENEKKIWIIRCLSQSPNSQLNLY